MVFNSRVVFLGANSGKQQDQQVPDTPFGDISMEFVCNHASSKYQMDDECNSFMANFFDDEMVENIDGFEAVLQREKEFSSLGPLLLSAIECSVEGKGTFIPLVLFLQQY
mgnify:CR=1 FL=1